MNIQSRFAKTFTLVFTLTALSWLLAFGSAVLAGDRPFPQATLARVNQGVNQTVPLDLQRKVALDGIKRVEIQVGSANVEIVHSSAAEVAAHLTGDGPKDTSLEAKQNDGTLTLRVESGSNFVFNVGDNMRPLLLKVALPAKYAGDLAVKSGSGDIAADRVEVARLEVNVGSGDVKMSDVNAKAMEAKTGSGDLSFAKVSSPEFKLSAGSGDITVGQLISSNAEARTGSGDVTIQLKDLKNWTATVRSGSGEIQSDLPGAEWSDRNHRLKAGKGENSLNIETGSGDIRISL